MEKMLDSKAAKNWFGISTKTWDRWCEADESGLLKPIQQKRRGKRLWLESNLRLWIERNQSKSPPTVNVESPSERTKRLGAAMRALEELGVKFNKPAK